MPQEDSTAGRLVPRTRTIAPGVRLHVLRTRRFTTSACRVVLHRDLGAEATATAVLAEVLQSATARLSTRQALAHALADLYGATLAVSVDKLGDRQVLNAAIEWPTAHVPRADEQLGRGLELLREVLTEPKAQGEGSSRRLDEETVATECVNHRRALSALADDKGRKTLRRLVSVAFAGEPFALDAQGHEEALGAVTPSSLAALHQRLLATAPAEIFLMGDLPLGKAAQAVRRHLLWRPRATRISRLPAVASSRPARARPRRIVEEDSITQARLAMAFRARLRPTSPLAPAAQTLAGVLGGGTFGRLFRVVREEHGLCYDAGAGWNAAKGLLLVQGGIDASTEPQARRLIHRLVREVASGHLDPIALEGFRKAVAHQFEAMGDSRGATMGWLQHCLSLGIDPSPARMHAALDSVTPAMVRRVGRKLGLEATVFLRGTEGRGA